MRDRPGPWTPTRRSPAALSWRLPATTRRALPLTRTPAKLSPVSTMQAPTAYFRWPGEPEGRFAATGLAPLLCPGPSFWNRRPWALAGDRIRLGPFGALPVLAWRRSAGTHATASSTEKRAIWGIVDDAHSIPESVTRRHQRRRLDKPRPSVGARAAQSGPAPVAEIVPTTSWSKSRSGEVSTILTV